MNVKDLSSKTVISTGIIIPGWSAVRALYSLQNIIMLTPCAYATKTRRNTTGQSRRTTRTQIKSQHTRHTHARMTVVATSRRVSRDVRVDERAPETRRHIANPQPLRSFMHRLSRPMRAHATHARCVRARNRHERIQTHTFEPSAGPIGGAGFALPASIASLMYPATFAAMTTGRRAPACARTSRRATAFAMNALVVCTRAVHPSVSALLARSEDVVHARVFVAARGAGVAPMGVAARIAVVNIVDVR